MKYFALKLVADGFDFICVSKTKKEFEGKIDRYYWSWKGIQAKGNNLTLEDFLRNYKEVVIEVTETPGGR